MRHDLFAKRAEVGGVAKHFADLHGEKPDQARQHRGIVQHGFLHGRDGRKAQMLARLSQPPLHRGEGVVAEVVVILLV